MKILLISSYRFEKLSRTDIAPPLNLLCLAAVLRESGITPEILDLNLTEISQGKNDEESYINEIIGSCERIDDKLLVGLSCLTTSHFPFMRKAAAEIKKRFPEVVICIGGVHPTLFASEIITNCPEFDYVVIGEGEEQIVGLSESLRKNDRTLLRNIQSLCYRNAGGEAVVNPRRNYIKDLDTLPMPAWDMIDYGKYYRDHNNWRNPKGHDIRISIPIMTTRSCPYDCNFCSAHKTMGRGFRRRSPARVVDEIEYHCKEFGHNYFGFSDDNLTLNKSHILEICNEIVRRGLDIQFESFNGYNLASLDEEVVSAMVDAGCVYVILPIEHGNDYMRNDIIGKRLPREKIFEVAGLYKQYGLLTRGMFIMGFPEDTRETLDDTLRMINALQLDMINVFTLIPFPGTKIFTQVIRDNLLVGDVDISNLWSGEMGLDTGGGEFYIKPYNMSMEELCEYRKKFDELACL